MKKQKLLIEQSLYQPLGFQFYSNFMVMYYSYRKIGYKQTRESGVAGKISGFFSLGEDK